MKCLSIKQPWASLIVMGLKDIENRNWKTTYRGPLLIHASKTYDLEGEMWLQSQPAYKEECLTLIKEGYLLPCRFPRGLIIGCVDMIECFAAHPSKWFWGEYGFIFINPRKFSAYLPYHGFPGLFDVPDKIVEGLL